MALRKSDVEVAQNNTDATKTGPGTSASADKGKNGNGFSHNPKPSPEELVQIMESVPAGPGDAEVVCDEPGEPGWPAAPVK